MGKEPARGKDVFCVSCAVCYVTALCAVDAVVTVPEQEVAGEPMFSTGPTQEQELDHYEQAKTGKERE